MGLDLVTRLRDTFSPRGRIVQPVNHGKLDSNVRWTARLEVPPEELRASYRSGALHDAIKGWNAQVDLARGLARLMPEPNLVVNSGIQRSLDRLFSINGPPAALQTIGVDDGAANPVAGTTSSSAGSAARRLVAFSPTPTRAGQVVTATGTFTQANVAFIMKRLFLSAAAAGTADAAGDLYAMTNVFTMDLTAFTTWSQTFEAEVTGTGS